MARHAVLLAGCLLLLFGTAANAQHVLFLRGGAGTGGFLEGGADEQLSDIRDSSRARGNHGWFELAQLLGADGYTLTQRIEGPAGNNTPVPLADLDLSLYDVIVFASNNAAYAREDIDSVEAYVRGGGAALFISDANWGRNWGDAPSSDQQFLDRFGLVMNQDRGVYALMRDMNHFVIDGVDRGGHPILDGVNAFDGEGVSPITIARAVPGVTANVLARALQPVQQNDSTGAGSVRAPTSADGALVVAHAGQGRIACHFDRNTFFNANGAGSSLHRFDNARYARSLFSWLSGRQPTRVAEFPWKPDTETLRVHLHPMPVRDRLSLRLKSARHSTVTLDIRDVQGRRHWFADGITLTPDAWRDILLRCDGFSPGTYVLSVRSAASVALRRIVVAP